MPAVVPPSPVEEKEVREREGERIKEGKKWEKQLRRRDHYAYDVSSLNFWLSNFFSPWITLVNNFILGLILNDMGKRYLVKI